MVTMWDPLHNSGAQREERWGMVRKGSMKYQQYQKGSWRLKTQVSLAQFYVHRLDSPVPTVLRFCPLFYLPALVCTRERERWLY